MWSMKPFSLLLLVVAAAGLAACGGGGGSVAPAPLPGQSAADAQATLNAYNLHLQATAAVQAQQTAVAAQATAAHGDMLRATAGAATAVSYGATVQAQTTADALTVRQTEVAVQMVVDSATAAAAATNTWATPTAAAQQTADAQNAANVALVQQDTKVKMEQQQRREDMRLKWQPILYVAGVFALGSMALAGLGFLGFILWRAVQLQRTPVISISNGMNVLQQSRGLLAAPKLLAISGPRTAAAPPAGSLPALAGPGLPPRVELPAMSNSHVLVVGETTTGKSGVLREVIKRREGMVIVCDPHYRPGAWPANVKEIVGVASRYDCVEDLMNWLGDELRRRIDRRAANDVDFQPITVAMDEQPDLNKKVAAEALDMWKDIVRQGAKYNLFVIMGSQSYLVKDMGLEGESSVLRNFRYTVLLGSFAIEKNRALDPLGDRAAVVVQARRTPIPVAIPYAAHEDPRSSEFRPPTVLPPVNAGLYHAAADEFFNGAAVVNAPIVLPAPSSPVIEQPPTDPTLYGMQTSRGFVSPTEIEKILEARRRAMPHYQIEEYTFGPGKKNGAFYYMVEDVLRHFEMSDSTASTAR